MRVRILIFLFMVIWISLLTRVFYLTVSSNDYYKSLSNKNTIKIEEVAPIRGDILDRNRRPLAINKLGFKIKLAPHLNTKNRHGELVECIDFIHSLLPFLDTEKLLKQYEKFDSHYNHNFITLVDFISYEEIVPVYTKLGLNENIRVIPATKRYYPNGKVAAHIIGYMAKANQKDVDKDPVLKLIGSVGKSGIEKYYNDYLEGVPGERELKVSATNEEIEELGFKAPLENKNLVLTLDLRLERYIGELFKDMSGAVVVMKTNGEVLAAGSYPEYDINSFVSGISTKKWNRLINDPDAPFTNKVVNGLYPPGSTIKTGMGLIYLSSGISQWWNVHCHGTMKLGDRNFRCWKGSGHEKTDINKAIRESCDDYFYKGSLKVGIAKMSEGLKKFGLGKKTGVDLPNEFIGTVPNRLWKRQRFRQPWYIGETLNTSIGQGNLLVTPLQMAQFTALMASGKLPVPHFALYLDEKPFKGEIREVLTPEQKEKLPIIQKAMSQVCNHPKGTAFNHITSKIRIAGKTGTAQVIGISQATKKRIKENEMAYYTRSHAWLTTYGPVKKPQVVVTVLVEHGGHGGSAAGKIVSRIYDKLLKLGYVDYKNNTPLKRLQ